jgi:uncharacterized protein with PQ loop repeat
MSHYHPALHKHLKNKKRLTVFDKIIIVAAFVYPLTGIPQIYEVFRGNISGVSVMAWLGFIIFSVLFLVYGIIHNIKPMVVTNALWVFVDSLVVIGVLVHIMVT